MHPADLVDRLFPRCSCVATPAANHLQLAFNRPSSGAPMDPLYEGSLRCLPHSPPQPSYRPRPSWPPNFQELIFISIADLPSTLLEVRDTRFYLFIICSSIYLLINYLLFLYLFVLFINYLLFILGSLNEVAQALSKKATDLETKAANAAAEGNLVRTRHDTRHTTRDAHMMT
jgi:TM2 domain-containing membrane protein YozV